MLFICPEKPLEVTCESTGPGWPLIQWRIMFDLKSQSDVTHIYIPSDPEGDIHTVASNGLDMVFNLTVKNQSLLVSTLTLILNGDTVVTNTTVYCGQESHLKTVIVVQGS